MRRILPVFIALFLGVSILGCGKQQLATEESMRQLSMEELSSVDSINPSLTEAVSPAVDMQGSQNFTSGAQGQLEPLPPSGPFKPADKDIQTALKNAGLYTALIDGKIGPITRKAIEDFQMANGLKVDGKVGPKTWAVLSKYLVAQPAPAASSVKKNKGK